LIFRELLRFVYRMASLAFVIGDMCYLQRKSVC